LINISFRCFLNIVTHFHFLFLDQQSHLEPMEPHLQHPLVIPSPQPPNGFHSWHRLCHLQLMLKLVDLFQHSLLSFEFAFIKNIDNILFYFLVNFSFFHL
jgi:hypothetical protein